MIIKDEEKEGLNRAFSIFFEEKDEKKKATERPSLEQRRTRGAWLAPLVQHATLDLLVVELEPHVGHTA